MKGPLPRLLPAALLCALGAAGAAPPGEEAPPRPPLSLLAPAGAGPAGASIAADRIVEEEKGVYRLEGYADLTYGGLRVQADRVRFDSNTQTAEADGNVILSQGDSTLGAARMTVQLDTGEATLWEVTGYTPPYYQFRAERLERLDAERFWIYNAVFTTCTQPVPYWSFKVRKAFIRLDHYAHLHGAAFKTSKAPLLYVPYMVWPVKRERASGFLMPEVGSSRERGFFLGTAFFWAMRRNMDATIYLDYYGEAGLAEGLEFRYLPNARGSGRFLGYYLASDVDAERSTRYRYHYDADQDLGDGWRLLADLNEVSDADYYLDFERDLGLSVSPDVFSVVDLSRTWSYYSLNLRTERREQFFGSTTTLEQQRLPEAEIRGRSQRLGSSPLYLSFQGSAAGLRREETALDADYRRLDAEMVLSAPLTPAPWLDLTPRLGLRDTYYTQRRDPSRPDGVDDGALNRPLYSFSLDLLGPKLYRIFDPPAGRRGPRYKNIFEPRIVYSYISDFDDADQVLLYDEVDSLPLDSNVATFSLVNRLFRRMPVRGGGDREGEDYDPALEIASFELRQSVSFSRDLTTSTSLDDGSRRGPLTFLARYSPSRMVNADLRLDWDVLFQEIRSATLSGTASSDRFGRVTLSYFLNRGLEEGAGDTGTIRLGGGTALFRRKILLDLDLVYDLRIDSFQIQRYRFGYETQCCGFQTEYLRRDYGGLLEPARELRFTVSLKGVGNFLDLNSRLN